jgi:hypothetical protein
MDSVGEPAMASRLNSRPLKTEILNRLMTRFLGSAVEEYSTAKDVGEDFSCQEFTVA